MRTYVYVDGFNLYYRSLKGAPAGLKWLNPLLLCQRKFPKNQIEKIRYFTAEVSATPTDSQRPFRQQIYFEALRSLGIVEFEMGRHVVRQAWMDSTMPSDRRASK
jgi:hypothetical protein